VERTGSSAQAQYPSAAAPNNPPPFDKFCIAHIATTCDEHGVYVTKDSAEVIEIGWVVVDARDPSLPEVCHRIHPWECIQIHGKIALPPANATARLTDAV